MDFVCIPTTIAFAFPLTKINYQKLFAEIQSAAKIENFNFRKIWTIIENWRDSNYVMKRSALWSLFCSYYLFMVLTHTHSVAPQVFSTTLNAYPNEKPFYPHSRIRRWKNNSQNFWNFSAKKYFFQQFIDWFRVWILTRQKYGNTDFIHCTSKLHNKHAFSWTHRLWVCVCVRVHVYSYIGVYTFFLTRCIADTRSKWYSTGVQ